MWSDDPPDDEHRHQSGEVSGEVFIPATIDIVVGQWRRAPVLPTPDYEIRSAFIGRTVTGRQRAADDTVRCRCPSGRSSLDLVVAYATATAPPSVVTAGLFLASEVFC